MRGRPSSPRPASTHARAALRYGFVERGFGRIVAVAMPENRASIHVMEKIGMRYAGRTRMYGHELVKYATDG